MHWVTRDRPKIDRIACPLIARFVDQELGLLFVPPRCPKWRAPMGAVPFDVPDVERSHLCWLNAAEIVLIGGTFKLPTCLNESYWRAASSRAPPWMENSARQHA